MASYYQFVAEFPDDDACLHHLMETRYGGLEFDCPKCKRASKFHRVRSERSHVCQWCGHHVYPCVGTPMEGSKTPLHKWFYAIFLFTHSRHGVPAKELQRQLGVTYKTAWRMAHLIREQMAELQSQDLKNQPVQLKGEVEADETYVGGRRPGKPGRGAAGKTIVFGVLERVGEIRVQVVPDVRRHTLEPIIERAVKPGSTVYTDELASYNRLDRAGFVHETVHHRAWEFARGACHVNGLEGFWARLKLSIRGTHVWVSGKHLWKYVAEFAWRYNRRYCPESMFAELVGGL